MIVALGHQDVDPSDLVPPTGLTVLGASSDHLVLDAGTARPEVGSEIIFSAGYRALVRAATSPFVATVVRGRQGRAPSPAASLSR